MKRTIRKMLVTLTIAGTVAVSSLGATAAEMNVSVDNTQESVARFMHTYTETITVDYPSASSVPWHIIMNIIVVVWKYGIEEL